MPKLLELRGLQASGKSTFAKSLVEADGWVRVNRDDLRASLFGGKWTAKREDLIREAELALAYEALDHGYDVVVDDMNLSHSTQSMWEQFIKGHNLTRNNTGKWIEHEIKYFFTPLDECIARDATRAKPIGRAIIENTALQYGLIPELDIHQGKGQMIVLCDIDGTIADLTHRRKFVDGSLGEKKDWDSFFANMGEDEPITAVINWVNALYDSKVWIFLVSGRNTDTQFATRGWLERQGVRFHRLFMRKSSDHRPDFQVKADILKLIPQHHILFSIDDRPQVCDLVWRWNRIPVFQVGTWNEWPASEYKAIEDEITRRIKPKATKEMDDLCNTNPIWRSSAGTLTPYELSPSPSKVPSQ